MVLVGAEHTFAGGYKEYRNGEENQRRYNNQRVEEQVPQK